MNFQVQNSEVWHEAKIWISGKIFFLEFFFGIRYLLFCPCECLADQPVLWLGRALIGSYSDWLVLWLARALIGSWNQHRFEPLSKCISILSRLFDSYFKNGHRLKSYYLTVETKMVKCGQFVVILFSGWSLDDLGLINNLWIDHVVKRGLLKIKRS